MDRALHLNKFESPSPKNALCQVWLKLAKLFWKRYLNFDNEFLLFRYYPLLEKGGTLHLNKLESPSPKDCLVEIGQAVLEKIFKFWQCIFAISLLSILEKGRDPTFEQLEYPLSKDALCQVWLRFAQWFWRSFVISINVFSLFCNNLPFEKGGALHLKKLESPLPKDALC